MDTKPKNVMLDLETMSTDSDAAIVAIGAVVFYPETSTLGDTFYRAIDLETSMQHGGTVSGSTISWWLKASDEARMALLTDPDDLLCAMRAFRDWLPDNTLMWGNGAGFDNVVLANAYKRSGVRPPWKFWDDRCYRTMKATRPDIVLERSGTHHNALDDAISQAKHLMAILSAKPS